MAGKISPFQYQADDGKIYQLRMDESNAKAVKNTAAGEAVPALPRRLTPRMVHCQLFDGGTKKLHKRSIPVGDRNSPLFKQSSNITLLYFQETGAASGSWKITGYTGEKRTF